MPSVVYDIILALADDFDEPELFEELLPELEELVFVVELSVTSSLYSE